MKRTFVRELRPGRRPRKRGVCRLFALGAAFAASATMGEGLARAQSASPVDASGQAASPAAGQLRFDIPAGPLREVVRRYEDVTQIKVTLAMTGIGDIQSPGVSGTMTPRAALDQLLTGTAVSSSFARANAVTLDLKTVSEFVAVSGDAPAPTSPKYTQPLRDTPQTIVVIPQHVFDEQGATSLRDVLRNTPGITLTAGEGGTAPGDNLQIRGFSARNDVYVDGARDPGVVSRDTFNTEVVEVAKGPSSVTAGRGSTGGSIDLVTKKALLNDSMSLRVTGGNADYKRSTLDVNRKISDTVAVRVNGMWQDAGVARRDDVTQKGWGFAPSVGFGLGRPTSVTLNYQHLHQNNMPDYGLPGTLPDLAIAKGQTVDNLDFSNFYGLESRDHEKVESDVASATIDHRFSRTLSFRNLTRYGRNNLDRVVTPPRAATAANAATDPGFDPSISQIRRTDTKYQYRNDKTFTNQADLTSSFTTGGVGHSVVTGVEVARDWQPSYAATDAFTNGRPPVTDLFNPTATDNYVPAIVRTGASSDAVATSAALYAFDTVKLGQHWQLDAGGRWDRIEIDYTTVATTGVPADFGRTDKAFSGRTGLVYKPVARGTIYGAFSTSFNPSYDGAFGLTLAATGVNAAALPPERSRNFELGTKWDLKRDLFVTAALFRTEKTNAKTTDAAGITTLAGDQQVSGVELGMSGRLTSRWGVFSGISLMDGTVEESAVPAEVDRRLSYVPRTSFNLWSTFDFPTGLTVGGGAQFTDGYFFNNTNAFASANAAAVQRLTRYWLFNAMAMHQFGRHLNLQLNATNLANERYVDRGYTGHFIPGAGRTVLLGPVFTF